MPFPRGGTALLFPTLVGLVVAGCERPLSEEAVEVAARGGAPYEVEATPLVTIGIIGDTLQELVTPRMPSLMPNGNLVVALERWRVIRVYDPEGRFVASYGRQGDGPGEFQGLAAAWARGDTIEAWDRMHRRITRFLPDGTVDVISLFAPGAVSLGSALPGILPDGWAVASIRGAAPMPVEDMRRLPPRRDEIDIHGFLRDGRYAGLLASAGAITRLPVGSPVLQPRAVARLAGGEVYIGDTLFPTVWVAGIPPHPRRQISWTPDPVPYTAEEAWEMVVDTLLTLRRAGEYVVVDGQARAVPSGDFETDPFRELSVFWDFHPDDAGFLWVRPFELFEHASSMASTGFNYVQSSPPGGEWMILDSEGSRVGTVQVPDGLRPSQITRDRMVGVRIDAEGYEYVQVHRVLRRE